MNKDVKLGLEISKLKEDRQFDEIARVISGKTDCYVSLAKLKPLYDEYGYKEVNELILELYDDMKKEKENEQ